MIRKLVIEDFQIFKSDAMILRDLEGVFGNHLKWPFGML